MSNAHTTLPIRKRQILDGSGESTTSRTVLCPAHGQAIAVSVCGECARCEHVDGDEVVCQPPVIEAHAWTPIFQRLLSIAADRILLAEVMSRDVVCVTTDVSVEALTAMLLERGIGAAPVVDAAGFPIGVVTKTDLVRERSENGANEEILCDELIDGMHVTDVARATVADIMMPIAFTLREDEPLGRAAALMTVERVHHLPVVDADGRVVGMLSSLDFVRWMAVETGCVPPA
jgi:CBS domain-containing protein